MDVAVSWRIDTTGGQLVTPEVLATWVGSIGTWVGSIAVALTLILTATKMLREERLRRRDRERHQAESIAAWYEGIDGESTILKIANSSPLPIYEAVVSLVFVQGTAPRSLEEWVALARQAKGYGSLSYGATYTALGPGEWIVKVPGGWGTMLSRPGCEIGFTDAAGRNWIRRAGGQLIQIDDGVIDYLGIDRPVDFQAPERAPNSAS